MAVKILIDGYNLLNICPFFDPRIPFEKSRSQLITFLSQYKRNRGIPITIVFDGHLSGQEKEQKFREAGIDILFSRKGETADTVLLRRAQRERAQLLIVTSDISLSTAVEAAGSSVVSSQNFLKKIGESISNVSEGWVYRREEEGWEGHTKKKGPSHRLPKKKREALRKLKKL